MRTKGAKRPAKRAPAKRGARKPRRVLHDVATLHEDTPAQLLQTNQNFVSYNLSLDSSTRAKVVAQGYQFYRIKRVIYQVKPLMDTFVQGTGSPQTQASVPYLYWIIDRVKQFGAGATLDQLRAMGAKPRRLDDKTLTFSYAPSVLTQTYDNTAGASLSVQYKVSPWLPCRDPNSPSGTFNANSTDHLGCLWRVEQALGTNTIGYQIERRIIYEFKKPAVLTSLAEGEDAPVDVFDPLVIPPKPEVV